MPRWFRLSHTPDLLHLFDAGARDLPSSSSRQAPQCPSRSDFRPGEPKTPHHVGKGVLLRLTKDFPIYPIDVQDDSLNSTVPPLKGWIFSRNKAVAFSPRLKAIRLRRTSSGTLSSSGRALLAHEIRDGRTITGTHHLNEVDVSDRRACSGRATVLRHVRRGSA